MAIFVFASLTVLLTFFGYRKRSRLFLLLLQFLPFFFLFIFLWFSRSHYEILQVQKLGYQFEKINADYRKPARTVMIGGDRQKDDLYSEDLPASAVKITPSLSDGSSEIEILKDGILLIKDDRPLNVIYLQDSDVISKDHDQLIFRSGGAFSRSFSTNEKQWNWPRKSTNQKIKQPFFTNGFDSQTIALQEIGKQIGLSLSSKAAVYLDTLHIAAGRRPIQVNAAVLIGGKGITVNSIALPDRFRIEDGSSLRIYAIVNSEAGTRVDPAFAFRIRNGQTFEFINQTPQTIGMKEALLRSGGNTNKPLLVTTTTLPYSVFPTIHYSNESETFSGLSAFVQLQEPPEGENLLARIQQRLQKLFAIESKSIEVVTDEGVFHPEDGQPILLGKDDHLTVSIRQIHFPWQMLQLLFVLFLLKILFQPPFFSAIENASAQWMLVTVDFFLATRLLYAFRAASLYPFSSESLDLALFAVLLVPYLIFAASICSLPEWRRTHLNNFVMYSAMALVIAGLFLPDHLTLFASIVFLTGATAFVRYHPRSFLPLIQTRIDSYRTINSDLILLAMLGIAVVFRLAGAGEALRVAGMRFPLALFYNPVYLLLQCYYLLQLNRASQGEKNPETLKQVFHWLSRIVLSLLVFLVISFLMADLGFFLLYCLPVLFLLFGTAALLLSQYELRWKGAGLITALPLALMFLGLFSTSAIDRIVPHSYLDNRYVERILLAVDPGVLEESGLIAAEKQLGHKRTFLAYSHAGFTGAGYMERPISSALAATALNDNVPSVFLLNDFGLAGFAGVLLVLLLWIYLWMAAAPSGPAGYGRMLSAGALVTLIFVDIYMILSNCGIFLFTGKNVFLWGLNSTSDLFHSALLLCFLLIPLLPTPAVETAPEKLELPMTPVAGEWRSV
jgi:hypothetical protein